MTRSSEKEKHIRRHRRVRAKIVGTSERPRLSVSRSEAHIQAQLIDDEKGATIIGMSDLSLKVKGTKSERARAVGAAIAKEAVGKGIEKVVFDRGGFRYQGRVAQLAEGAREAGLKF